VTYLLIAGTYTPFTLVSLRGPWGWTQFTLIWGLAFFGIILKLVDVSRFCRLSVVLCLGMGWLVVIATVPMLVSIDTSGLLLLLCGGLSYTLGNVFYA